MGRGRNETRWPVVWPSRQRSILAGWRRELIVYRLDRSLRKLRSAEDCALSPKAPSASQVPFPRRPACSIRIEAIAADVSRSAASPLQVSVRSTPEDTSNPSSQAPSPRCSEFEPPFVPHPTGGALILPILVSRF